MNTDMSNKSRKKDFGPFAVVNTLFFMVFSLAIIVYFGAHTFDETLDWLADYWPRFLVAYGFGFVLAAASK